MVLLCLHVINQGKLAQYRIYTILCQFALCYNMKILAFKQYVFACTECRSDSIMLIF